MSDFFAMGGYGAYVWTSYAVFFIVLAAEAVLPPLKRRRVLAELRGKWKRAQRREGSAP
ncbi:MAG: heme exporter protein CcmD [Lysobacterales bacterium]